MIERLRKVTDQLYRGSAPSPKDVKWLKENLGINKIVSLDEDAGNRIAKTCKLLGIKHVMFPLFIDKKSIIKLLSADLQELLISDGPTYVHCHYGKDRTGLIIAMFKCRYLGMLPKDAIEEAKSLGFGIGVEDDIVKLYEKIIKSCKPLQDENAADIVSNTREYISDNRSGPLNEAHQGSFAPYLSQTRQMPFDAIYNEINDQSPTRENYPDYKPITKHDKEGVIPPVGQYNNNAGIQGFGPVINPGGFIFD